MGRTRSSGFDSFLHYTLRRRGRRDRVDRGVGRAPSTEALTPVSLKVRRFEDPIRLNTELLAQELECVLRRERLPAHGNHDEVDKEENPAIQVAMV